MTDDSISSLPIQLAIRLTLDSVSYSNPLPNWFDILAINYSAREKVIRGKIEEYLNGTPPKSPYEVMVPKKNGQMARWVVPSINDQIVFQTCVSSIAEVIDEMTIDKARVFSCRYNQDSNRLALLENQVSAWKEFQDETKKRCESDQCVLQIDLEDAFRSVDRARFIDFLRKFSPDGISVKLLHLLLNTFAGAEPGLPLMNDAGFFLGSAYFSEVDKLIARYTPNFIRFVDDYRVFADSREKLESLLESISRELQPIGFRINAHKLKLGSAEEYLEAVSKIKYAASDIADYIDVAFGDVVRPTDMVAQLTRTLEKPDDYLNQGVGRLQIAALRRMHVDALIAEKTTRELKMSVRYLFSEQLSSDMNVLGRLSQLLKSYSQDNSQIWRTLWLLYLIKDLHFYREVGDTSWKLPADLESTLNRLKASDAVPQIVKLWASEIPNADKKTERQDLVEQLHECDYLECGVRYYGNA